VDLATVQSNMVNLDVAGLGIDAGTFAGHLQKSGVRGLPGMGTVLRFVTYRGITRDHIEQAIEAVRQTATVRPWAGVAV
jgi:threonine aldolase